MDLFIKAYEFMRENEGGFSNDPDDNGGQTAFGVSSVYHPLVFTQLFFADKTERENILKRFYKEKYWNDLYDNLHDPVLAVKLFDLGVNIGKKKVIQILQNCYNVEGGYDLKTDGIFGIITLSCCNRQDIYMKFIHAVGYYYYTRSTFWKFGKGWINRLRRRP